MTVDAAKLKAKRLPGCRGFCFVGKLRDGPVDVFFKNKWDNRIDPTMPWTSYQLDVPELPPPPEQASVEVQVDFTTADDSPAAGTHGDGEKLRFMLEELQAEKDSAEQDGLRELEELRALVRSQKQKQLEAEAKAEEERRRAN